MAVQYLLCTVWYLRDRLSRRHASVHLHSAPEDTYSFVASQLGIGKFVDKSNMGARVCDSSAVGMRVTV